MYSSIPTSDSMDGATIKILVRVGIKRYFIITENQIELHCEELYRQMNHIECQKRRFYISHKEYIFDTSANDRQYVTEERLSSYREDPYLYSIILGIATIT